MAINRSNINLQTTRGKKMKDFSGDGKITQKDVLIGRGVLQKEGDKFVAKQYGGTSKNIRDGNKEVSQFYDKGEK